MHSSIRWSARIATLVCITLALASCGGGGGGGSSSATTPVTTSPFIANPPAEGLGGMSGPNVLPVTVGSGINGNVPNLPYVTVTICAPNDATNCATIPDVQLDTGSVGLRLIASAIDAVNPNLRSAMTVVTNGAGNPVAQCAQFADGVSWGTVRSATVQLASETGANAISVHVLGDVTAGNIPSECSNVGTEEDTTGTIGGNGIIGVGYFDQDCGAYCVSNAVSPNVYYGCPTTSSCMGTTLALASQVSNPVVALPLPYNNGDIILLPAVPATGASLASGFLVLGVATAANNGLGTAAPIGLDEFGDLTVNYKGAANNESFIDSGSSIYFFNDTTIATCATTSEADGFYCPTANFSGTATLVGNSTPESSYAFNFEVRNALTLFKNAPAAFAFDDVAGPENSTELSTTETFDVGLPFFFGKSVYTVFENETVAGSAGPFAAVGPQ